MTKMLFLCLLIMATTAHAGTTRTNCAFGSSYDVSRSYSIQEIERAELAQIEAFVKVSPDIPKLPFGFQNPEWIYLKSIVQPGDKIVYFRWRPRPQASDAGVALVRACRVIHQIVTSQG